MKKNTSLGIRGRVLDQPPFTIKDLRAAIPPELFESSLLTSLTYLAKDLVMSTVITVLTMQALIFLPAYLVFPVYWVAQGSIWFGLWILAHECGHGAFSKYQKINDVIGLVLHSFLLVPYHAWRLSHSTHHKSTNHVDLDTAFPGSGYLVKRKTPNAFLRAVYIGVHLLAGLPGYLTLNIQGKSYPESHGRVNHFEPSSPIFHPRDYWDIIVSDIGIASMIGLMMWFGYTFGLCALICWQFAPYLVVNFWLVLVTFLQHTDTRVPKFKGEEFTFLRGAIGAVDRDFGLGNTLFHHITDSHVVHHLFSTMPFYNAIKATPIIKEKIGEYYNYDNRRVMTCLWEEFRDCQYIEGGDAEVWRQG